MKKKNGILIFCTLFVIYLLSCVKNVEANGQVLIDEGECGTGVAWQLCNSDVNEYELIISGTGDMHDYTNTNMIPWIQYSNEITKITIEEGVESVGNNAFYNTNISAISLPQSIKRIGKFAFAYSTVKSVDLPNSIEIIDLQAFQETNLETIFLPSSIETIGTNLFYGCDNIKYIFCEVDSAPEGWAKGWNGWISVNVNYGYTMNEYIYWRDLDRKCSKINVPEGITRIPNDAFRNNDNVKEVILPETIKEIGEFAFSGCISLETIVLPESLTQIGKYAFSNCEKLTEITIPSQIITIESGVFFECQRLKKVSMSDNVEIIGEGAFENCTSLVDIYLSEKLVTIQYSAFSNCLSLRRLYLPKSLKNVLAGSQIQSPFYKCSYELTLFLEEYKCFSTWWDCCSRHIDGYSREEYNNLIESLNNPKIEDEEILYYGECGSACGWAICKTGKMIIYGVGYMDDYDNVTDWVPWIAYLNEIKSLEIRNGIKNIGNYAFAEAEALENVSICESDFSIGEYAFSKCKKLEKITLYPYVVSIGNQAFSNCTSLESANIGKVNKINDGIFNGCNNLRMVQLSNDTYYIGAFAFENTAITQVFLPNTIRYIDSYAFRHSKITSLVLPSELTSVAKYSFAYCDNLKYVYIPANVRNVKEYAFYGDSNLVCIEIGENSKLENIESNAFGLDKKLTYINLPDTIKKIEITAFDTTNKDSLFFTVSSYGQATSYAMKYGIPYAFECNQHIIDFSNVLSEYSEKGIATFDCCNCKKSYGEIIDNNKFKKIDISVLNVVLNKSEFEYDGEEKKPLVVSLKNDYIELTDMEMFDIKYYDNIQIGNAIIEITPSLAGSKYFTGKATRLFLIKHSIHDYGEWENYIESTCSESGIKRRKCNICNVYEEIIEQKLSHNWEEPVYEWDENYEHCIAKFVCKNNPNHIESVNCNILQVKYIPATCEKTGSLSYEIESYIFDGNMYVPLAVYNKILEKKVHNCDKGITTTPATFMSDGKIETKCNDCNELISTRIINKINSVTLASTTYTYDGNEKKPVVTVKDSMNKTLVRGTDYTVIYDNDTKSVGTHKVVIKFKGNYLGTKELTYKIKKAKEVLSANVSYRTHVQTYGWQSFVKDGAMSGTSGKAKRLEGIEIKIDSSYDIGIIYTTHVQSYGWRDWSANGEMSGTSGEAKRLEAIKIQLTGSDADKFDVYYRVHAQTYGWLNWTKNGHAAGTAGYGKRLEGIQIVVVPKGSTAPSNTYKGIKSINKSAYISSDGKSDVTVSGADGVNVLYRTHVQSYGWQSFVSNGKMSGTSGKAKRLEGIEIKLTNKLYSGGIAYRTHIQSTGWQGWKTDGKMSGTSGQSKRLEAIEIELTGEMAEKYDVYYRVHAQNYGWLGWAKNGEPAGTSGYGYRLEGIQIVLVKKGAAAPSISYGGFKQNNSKKYICK